MSSENSKKRKKNPNNNLSYEEISSIVEYLVKVKSNNHVFDCYNEDDIGQEIRLICFKALNHFDSDKVEKSKRVNFFGRCVDNALHNLKRDKYIRYSNPCNGDCELLHGEDEELGKVCKKWRKHQEKIKRKKNIKHPISIEILGDIKDTQFEKIIEMEDIKMYLLSNIDSSLRQGLLDILSGNKKSVSSRDKKKIQIFVRRMLLE